MSTSGGPRSTGCSPKSWKTKTGRLSFTRIAAQRQRRLAEHIRKIRKHLAGILFSATKPTSLKKGICTSLLAALLWAAPARGLSVQQYEPVSNPDYINLPFDMTNDDNGAIYDSAEVMMFNSLVDQVYNLEHNKSRFNTKEDMLNDSQNPWSFDIVHPDNGGEVYSGWEKDCGDWSCIDIYNNGGWPGWDYTQWLSTSQNPSQDMMAITVGVPKDHLDGNANGWDPNESSDYKIALGQDVNDVVKASTSGISRFYGSAKQYNVQPAIAPYTIQKIQDANDLATYQLTNHSDKPLQEFFAEFDGYKDVSTDKDGWTVGPFYDEDIDNDSQLENGIEGFVCDPNFALQPGESLELTAATHYPDYDTRSCKFVPTDSQAVIGSYQGTTNTIRPADIDNDGFVDTADLSELSYSWLNPSLDAAADINEDGDVNLEDLAEIAGNWRLK
jgi:hypothetical protein